MSLTKTEAQPPAPATSAPVPDVTDQDRARPRHPQPARAAIARSPLLPGLAGASARAQQSGAWQRSFGNARVNRALANGTPPMVQRDLFDLDDLRKRAENLATVLLLELANRPVGTPKGAFTNPDCPPNFCQPFADPQRALLDLAWVRPVVLEGVKRKVNSRVAPLWDTYINGGAAPQDLTSTFGLDFTLSPTTFKTTRFLLDELKKDITANHASLLGSLSSVIIDFTPRLSAAVSAIDTPKDPHEMNFDVIGDIAGNIAGGIGKDQTTFKVGAMPSPFNDDRKVKIIAELRRAGSSIIVLPSIRFSLHDTIDLCPGNCGAAREQVATVPLSRFEATGFCGDVPFTIDFAAPPTMLMPLIVTPPAPPPPPPPVKGKVTASELNIRAAPNTSAAIVGTYLMNKEITLECETTGTMVDGDDVWHRTDKGFVSNRYVTRLGGAAPPKC